MLNLSYEVFLNNLLFIGLKNSNFLLFIILLSLFPLSIEKKVFFLLSFLSFLFKEYYVFPLLNIFIFEFVFSNNFIE
jgi:hypothetical protein